MKQDESYGDLEFQVTIELGGKLTSYWKIDKREFQKWRGVCKAYRNAILEFDVGHTSFDNKGKACGAQVVSTTRSGTVRCMDWGFLEKA